MPKEETNKYPNPVSQAYQGNTQPGRPMKLKGLRAVQVPLKTKEDSAEMVYDMDTPNIKEYVYTDIGKDIHGRHSVENSKIRCCCCVP